MSKTIIKIENLSKQYRLGTVGTGTLAHDINRWWKTNILGKEDPYLKIGETNDRSQKGTSEYVWALKDINLELKEGDVVGVIGKNGAGKSTLLKILSRVTAPTTGNIRIDGRLASLLEVGTGFHPELTGRENIFLNGAILGMNKTEIKRKLDEIIDFSGCERYIDTPTKRYSSGMNVRLGFAVAAFLEPEILIVDEVLAVGDAEFQKKAIGKMQDVSSNDGRTVLFVSHNMGSIEQLCTSGVVLENGSICFKGTQLQAIDYYLSNSADIVNEWNLMKRTDRHGNGVVRFSKINIVNKVGQAISKLTSGESYDFIMDYIVKDQSRTELTRMLFSISISDIKGVKVFNYCSNLLENTYSIEQLGAKSKMVCSINDLPVLPGEYILNMSITQGFSYMDGFTEGFRIDVLQNPDAPLSVRPEDGHIRISGSWKLY